ncbi:outer membrane lipoprotein carrier protein LolA [Thermodesulfobacteriota bacterium]
MKLKIVIIFLCFLAFFNTRMVPCFGAESKNEKTDPSLDEVIAGVEKRYTVPDFSARFFQTSTLKAMEITDTASGRLLIKRPGMMRWDYEKPDRQIVISDGYQLWIYRPDDNQVLMGKAPSFFGDGKGASFLSDIGKMRKNFSITLEKSATKDYYLLKLLPIEKQFDLASIYLLISKKLFDVVRIVTHNSFGDETRIDLSNLQFDQDLDKALFSFITPEGAEILQIDE